MTATPPNPTPKSGQPTKIQFITILKKFLNSRPLQTISLGIIAFLFLIEKTNDLVQFYQSVCRTDLSSPWCSSELPKPEWIGTKIEDIYIKKLRDYEPETTLVVTDKPENTTENEDISVLRNVDQDLSKINQGKKRNSGQFEAFLRKARNQRKPVCLKIYGKRNFEKSEFKNIIDYSEFPRDQVYERLTSQQRNQVCDKKPTIQP